MSIFNFFNNANEQSLYNNNILEMQQMYGIPLKYMVRTVVNMDELFGEDPSSAFNSAVEVTMYLETSDGFGGADFFSKMGLTVDDSATLITQQTHIEELIGDIPKPGDVVYIVPLDTLFEITNVENDRSTFAVFGKHQTYRLTVKSFQYSGETLATGDIDIDELDGETDLASTEDSTIFEAETATILDFNESDPFS